MESCTGQECLPAHRVRWSLPVFHWLGFGIRPQFMTYEGLPPCLISQVVHFSRFQLRHLKIRTYLPLLLGIEVWTCFRFILLIDRSLMLRSSALAFWAQLSLVSLVHFSCSGLLFSSQENQLRVSEQLLFWESFRYAPRFCWSSGLSR